ncbi:MAG: DNA-binding response regulator [Sphingomonadaceae bacterium]|nr:DNA-binding response regulator [Sphingomonadaceae bacterium]
MTRILCIDDEAAIIRLLQVVLGKDGHEAVGVSNWQAAKAVLEQRDVGAVLLDLGLPDRDGLELIPLIKNLSNAPIIVVSARNDISEKVAALDLGAVDYLTKPFDGDELRARLRAALRRGGVDQNTENVLAHGLIRMDPDRHEVEIDGRRVALTPKEYAVLKALVAAAGRILTHATLLEQVWGKSHREDVEYLRVAIRSLRLKIEDDPSQPRLIRNEPGIGYRLA